jgi:hypothetical protein
MPLSLLGNQASGTNADFSISGSLTVANSAVVTFYGGAGIHVVAGGSMSIQPMFNTVLSNNNQGGTLWNSGTLSYIGNASTTTTCNMPVLNRGSATFDTGKFVIGATSNTTNNKAVMMDSATATFKLRNAITLDISAGGYLQTAGEFDAPDSAATIIATSHSVDFNGGKVVLGSVGNAQAFCTLTINGGDLNFSNATLNVKINGQDLSGNNRDNIQVTTGKITITNSTLNVTDTGAPLLPKHGGKWVILSAPKGGKITDGFTKNLPAGITGPNSNALNNGNYELDSNT